MKIKFKDSSLKNFILKKAFSAFLFLILFTSFATSSFAADELAGGQIMSKETRTYGKIEIRMWAEQRSGTTSTYYWWREGGTTCGTDWNEIDIETLSGRGQYQSNALWQINNQPACDYPYKTEGWHSNAATVFGRWIVFTLEWAPGSIKWYHDGVLDRTLTGTAANTIANPMKYCFNLWSQGPTSGWLGNLDMGRLAYDPVYQFVDYFKYYAWTGNGYAGTPTKTINFDNYADLTANFNISTWEFWSQSNNYVHWRADAVGVVDLGGGNGGLWLGLFLNGNQRPPAGAEIPGGGGVVTPVLTTITVTPATATLTVGQTQQFTAAGKDQNGAAIAMTPTWTTTGGGTISASGLFTATVAGGPFTVRAASGAVSGTAAVTVNAAATPKAIPGVLQAEDYTAYNNAQPTQMRVATADGGTKIGYNDAGDWYDYSVNVATAGNYTVDFRVSNGAAAAGQFQLLKGAAVITTVDVAPTGGWENFVTLTKTVTLTAGTQTLRINTVTAGVDYNWFDFKQVIVCAPTALTAYSQVNGGAWLQTATSTLNAGGSIVLGPQPATGGTWSWTGPNGFTANTREITLNNIQTTQAGNYVASFTNTCGTKTTITNTITVTAVATGIAIPGTVQAEDYSAYNNVEVTQMRVATTDGGTKMGYNSVGDWYDYSVNVATAGNYTVTFRVSNGAAAAGQFQLMKGATVLTTVDVAPTGGWENFVTLTKTVAFTAGVQTIRLYTVTAGVDYNWFNAVLATNPVANSVAFNPPMVVESGDTYVIPVTYSSLTANEVQVAMLTNTFGWVVGQTQQVAAGSGVLNFTITVPGATAVGNTYIWQTEIRPVGGTWQQRYALAEKVNVQVVNLKSATVGINDRSIGNEISIYPVPVTNILNLKGVENVQKISVYNSVGQLLKQYQKGNETLFNIDVNELKSGIYFVELSNSNEKVTKKVIKK